VLDHIILNTRAQTLLSRFAYARNDADFPVKNYGDSSVLRISDHDQPVAYFTNTPPTADSQLVSTNEDTPKVITLTGSDTQTASADLTFTIVTGPTNGTLNPGTTGATQTYTPNANYNGPDSFTFKVSDGTVDSAPATVSITVDAVNDAPVNSGPAAQSVTENGSLTFSTGNSNLISIADVDAGTNAVKVTLTATQGTITLSGISGLSFTTGDGTSDATMTFTGTIANINAALNGMSITPTAGFSGAASLQVTTDDQGNTGSGGALTDTDTVNITVNDGGTLQFSAANYSVGESAGNASITITRTGGTAGTATVQFSTSNGTATAGSDYTAVTNQTVTFNDGDTSKTVNIPISNDLIDESNETVNLTLTNAGGSGALGSQSTAVLTINDDDPPGGFIVFSSATYTIAEDGGSALITVNRVGTNTSAVSVDYATSDMTATERKDYATALGTLNFAAGEISKTFKVLVNRDAFTEGSEFLGLTLSNVTGGADLAVPQNATLQIDDVAWIGPPANPIDQTDFFVIQHYHDFLNREPDAAGLAYWTDNINKCNDPARRLPGTTTEQCIEIQRINTSAAFFLSIEFQETGGTAYLAHKSAFNALPSYLRFERDTQRLQRDFIFGTPGAAAVLEANKVAYFNEFVAGSDFTAIYGLLNNDQYVDMLIANTGVTFTSSERSALVSGLNNSSETRATVLRKITEKSTFKQAEFTRAFVLMEYFGYLRRDPDTAGFNYWLNKLNSFNGNYIEAEMVKAFLSSFEYRERFGL
jgi:VCBS repeat-containing protein